MSLSLLGAGLSAPPVSPASVADLALWLDALTPSTLWQDSAGTTPAAADTDPVGRWSDRSGNAAHAAQGTSAKRPTLRLAAQNGRPAVRLDGVDDFLSLTLGSTPGAHTLLMALKLSGSGSDLGLIRLATAATTQGLTHHVGGVLYSYHGGGAKFASASLASGTPAVVARRWTGSAASLRVNGAAGTVSGTPDATGLSASAAIGEASSGAGYGSGDLFELLLYSRSLSDAEVLALEYYLRTRWGL